MNRIHTAIAAVALAAGLSACNAVPRVVTNIVSVNAPADPAATPVCQTGQDCTPSGQTTTTTIGTPPSTTEPCGGNVTGQCAHPSGWEDPNRLPVNTGPTTAPCPPSDITGYCG